MALAYSPLLLPLQIILLLLLLVPPLFLPTKAILLTYCGNTNYTSPSPYKSNLDTIISNLINSTTSTSSFYSTITLGNTPSSKIYGLAQCRPDVSPATCFDCLNRSAAAATGSADGGCPLRRSASLRDGECVLRYSDQNFFSMIEEYLFVIVKNTANASDPDKFSQRVNGLMEEIMPKAAKAESKFAVGVSNSSNLEDIYGMAWCTRDLYSSDCLNCLRRAAGALPTRQVGGQIAKVSCYVRFETQSFFSPSIAPPSESNASPPSELGTSLTPPAIFSVAFHQTGLAELGSNNGIASSRSMSWR